MLALLDLSLARCCAVPCTATPTAIVPPKPNPNRTETETQLGAHLSDSLAPSPPLSRGRKRTKRTGFARAGMRSMLAPVYRRLISSDLDPLYRNLVLLSSQRPLPLAPCPSLAPCLTNTRSFRPSAPLRCACSASRQPPAASSQLSFASYTARQPKSIPRLADPQPET